MDLQPRAGGPSISKIRKSPRKAKLFLQGGFSGAAAAECVAIKATYAARGSAGAGHQKMAPPWAVQAQMGGPMVPAFPAICGQKEKARRKSPPGAFSGELFGSGAGRKAAFRRKGERGASAPQKEKARRRAAGPELFRWAPVFRKQKSGAQRNAGPKARCFRCRSIFGILKI